MPTLLDDAIARLRALPEDRQDAAALAVLDVVRDLSAEEVLTAAELAEVRRRAASPPEYATEPEVGAFFDGSDW